MYHLNEIKYNTINKDCVIYSDEKKNYKKKRNVRTSRKTN